MGINNVNLFSVPITTGSINYGSVGINSKVEKQEDTGNFAELLKKKLSDSPIEFSKHATKRVIERQLDVSDKNIERLSKGVEIAAEKGLDDTLILIDSTAYIVSAKNQKVITAVDGDELRGNIFTNIDGTVII